MGMATEDMTTSHGAPLRKVCIACGELKPVEEYHKNHALKSGRENTCKVCKNAKRRALKAEQRKQAEARESVPEAGVATVEALSVAGCADVLRVFFPSGVAPNRYEDMLLVVAGMDELFRVAGGAEQNNP